MHSEILTSVSDTLSGKDDEGFARVLEPMDVSVPTRITGQHPEYQVEWWYYTGNLHTDDGKAFRLSVDLFPLCADTPNARADLTFRDEPSLYDAYSPVTDAAKRRVFLL